MPAKSPEAFHFSWTLTLGLGGAYGTACGSLLFGPLPAWATGPLLLLLLRQAVRDLRLHAWRSHPQAIVGLALQAAPTLRLSLKNGEKVLVECQKYKSRLTASALFLAFQGLEGPEKYALVLTPDACRSPWWSVLWREQAAFFPKKRIKSREKA